MQAIWHLKKEIILDIRRWTILGHHKRFNVDLYTIYKQLFKIFFRTSIPNMWSDYKIILLQGV